MMRNYRLLLLHNDGATMAVTACGELNPSLAQPLRYCTFPEVGALGGGFQRLAAAEPADAYVGEVLTDREARELLRPDALISANLI